MKLLIIEDDLRLARQIKHSFAAHHILDTACTDEGVEKALLVEYQVIILGLGLRNKGGLAVCRQLRKAGIPALILVLTYINTVDSRVALLNAGADDCLAKPFHNDDLHARVRALARRSVREYEDGLIWVKDLSINVYSREVSRAGIPIKLRRKEFDILVYLIKNKGRTVSRQMIFSNAWESDKDYWSNTVDVHLKHLRDKIDKPFEEPLIKAEYGIGYILEDGP